jgi:3-oxoacyl-[acyl-carrier-protein] synthase-1
MRENIIIPTLGFKELGVSKPIKVCDVLLEKQLNACIKTASGFGGCNASIILSKQ